MLKKFPLSSLTCKEDKKHFEKICQNHFSWKENHVCVMYYMITVFSITTRIGCLKYRNMLLLKKSVGIAFFFTGIMYNVFVFYSNDSFLPYHKAWCLNIQGYATFKKSDGIWYSLTGNVFCLGSDEDDATSRDWRLSLRQD